MRAPRPLIAAFLLAAAGATPQAQTVAAPQNVLQLSATGSVEVAQDWLVMSLSATREGADPTVVQNQLKGVLDAALAEARKSTLPEKMDVRTGNFSLYPRYSQAGRIASWQGTAELVLEGRDFPRITQAAARVQGLTVGNVSFALSREQRQRVEGDAQSQAIERFKAKAVELAGGFGFSGFSLREISVNTNDNGPMPRMRMQASAMPASADSPIPVEAGKSTVTVTVSGSVQLR